ncbi:MAG: phosphoenolpyruvate synthase [Lentimicrobiaceae bacterium]|nr:phosphoenolpyruvate synthase [Lentimicrobiaceae bacterium]
MLKNNKIKDIKKYYFREILFDNLMINRINKILLICSKYDAFILEDDGRIEEQIFNEYVSLNLRYPPHFLQVSTTEEACKVLETERIDLIISMMGMGNMDPFESASKFKAYYKNIPIVLLTPFSRDISLKISQGNLDAIDYVFCWLGNADIMLAIIKLLEDRMNLAHDVQEVGVQCLLLIEDSIRLYSSYLPSLYKLIFHQSLEFMSEGLNEHQKMLRMRGRPKILLATHMEEAISLYEKYKNNLLGIISDFSFNVNGQPDKYAGLRFCQWVKNNNSDIPILLQSSESQNYIKAKEINVGFIDKNSKTYSTEFRNFIIEKFSFGDFVFRNPQTNEEIFRVSDLKNLQDKLFDIPDDSFFYHISRNHFSKWLNARALFPIAEMLRKLRLDDFYDLDGARRFIFDAIVHYRLNKGRGVIADFYKEKFDEYIIFTRIGTGSIGGKARGLAFLDSLLKRNKMVDKHEGIIITIPRTVVLGTDVFDEFMQENDLYRIGLSDRSNEEILGNFVKARLPVRIHEDLLAFISVVKKPLAIRSSSLLEDSHYQPFAGIYSTYMIPNIPDDEQLMLEKLSIAIKSVYASVYFKDSKAYMTATKNVIDEEKMGIVLQEVCGKQYKNRFYPAISGVARSLNFYPIAPEKPEDGIVNVAFGLGKYIVDGGISLRFSPRYPQKVLQLYSPEMALRETQKYFYALDMKGESFHACVDDGVNIMNLPLRDAENDKALKYVASTFDFQNQVIRDGTLHEGKKIITFSNILQHNSFPLSDILNDILKIAHREMNVQVEIEFAVDLDVAPDEPIIFNLLQIRPIVDNDQNVKEEFDKVDPSQILISSDAALGNGTIKDICDIVYVKPELFNSSRNHELVEDIAKINDYFISEGKNYILIGPGRWGSSDPWLGIPVKWPQISQARLIIEAGLENYRIDPSQGTHFFQNLTSFRVGYFTINPCIKDGYYDVAYLNNSPAYYENTFLKHVKFDNPLIIRINGKKNKGIVLKSEHTNK